MKRTFITLASAVALAAAAAAAQAPNAPRASAGKTLDIYAIDTEGGGSTLFVTPTGQSLLIDTGSPGERDHTRIMEVLKAANVTRLDYMLSSHYHVDHVGGLAQLAAAMPIGMYVDHGPTVEEREQVANFQATYAELKAKAKSMVVKPGDRLPITGVEWRIVTSAGKAITAPISGAPGAGRPNAACVNSEPRDNPRDPENGQSVGSHITFGQFRTIMLGDLLWNNELDLMCPQNRMGTIDLYLVSHHGTDPSGSPALVHGIAPRVAVMQNGVTKGGTVQTATTLRTSPGFEDLWQLHWSHNVLLEHNAPGVMIANMSDPAVVAGLLTAPPRAGGPGGGGRQGGGAAGAPGPPGPGAPAPPAGQQPPAAPPQAAPAPAAGGPAVAGPPPPGRAAGPGAPGGRGGRGGGQPPHVPAHWIKISAQADGSFTVTNSRNGFSKTYGRR
jgi:beta-lactamase superfamily II metal-dependent hydrolase